MLKASLVPLADNTVDLHSLTADTYVDSLPMRRDESIITVVSSLAL